MLGEDSPESVLAREEVKPIVSAEILAGLRRLLAAVTTEPGLVDYVVDIVRETRREPSLLAGAGPRATQGLLLSARANAAVSGRDFVTPDDVKLMAVPVLAHRMVLRPEFEIEGLTVEEVVEKLLTKVAVPR